MVCGPAPTASPTAIRLIGCVAQAELEQLVLLTADTVPLPHSAGVAG